MIVYERNSDKYFFRFLKNYYNKKNMNIWIQISHKRRYKEDTKN